MDLGERMGHAQDLPPLAARPDEPAAAITPGVALRRLSLFPLYPEVNLVVEHSRYAFKKVCGDKVARIHCSQCILEIFCGVETHCVDEPSKQGAPVHGKPFYSLCLTARHHLAGLSVSRAVDPEAAAQVNGVVGG